MAHFRRERNLNPVLIIGCGDIGRRVAALCRARGAAVSALTRGAAAEDLRALGITPLAGDLDTPASLPPLPSAGAVVFYLAPPPAQGEGDPRLSAFLQHIATTPRPAKLIYISTSGVYGDHRGGWVTEDTPPTPSTARARRRLVAETALREWKKNSGVPLVILRVGGIYGPGRLPLERIRKGTPVLRAEQCGYTNRIHADDLAAVCLAAVFRGHGIYNVSDGQPSTMTDYFNGVADLYELPRPPQIDLEEAKRQFSAEMMSYLEESRRMDNRKMLHELGVRLRFPRLEEGLQACEVNTQSMQGGT